MRAHTINTVVEDDGVIAVEGLPVHAGQRVQVIVLMPDESSPAERYPLRGRKPFRYDQPNEPVGENDWESGR
ncbi:MAG TPA: hypothetical protein VIL86_11000 [Tepidisphaeraceae bacterium]|jgi:hypothetical protein